MTIAENIVTVQNRIISAAEWIGRDPTDVTLMLAAKHQPVENIRAAIDAGATTFGHNIAQQLATTNEELAKTDQHPFTAMIGPVQSNKMALVLAHADRIDSVDSVKTAERLARRRIAQVGEGGPAFPILLQVNSSGAATQSGADPDELLDIAREISEIPELRIDGLMTIGANSPDEAKVRRSFFLAKALSEQLREIPGLEGASVLSMGMTGDLELAIECGSTLVRVGTAVFGAREM